MAFSVQLTKAAKIDIAESIEFITSHAPGQAQKWFDGLFETMDSLSEMPARHAVIRESTHLNRSLRGLFYYSHRIVYEIVYHFARASLKPEDLQ